MTGRVELLGILNVTPDSFSDGGRWTEPRAAVERGLALVADGATWVDVGAESTHPDAPPVPADLELRRLEPVVGGLVEAGVRVSVDTWKPEVMRRALALGARAVNDVNGFRAPGAAEAVRDGDARLVVMFSAWQGAKAERGAGIAAAPDPVAAVRDGLAARVAALERAGVARERLVVDPGMGLFLSDDAAASVAVLRGLGRLREPGLPLCVCTSRKGFLNALLGRDARARERGAATLATELWAVRAGATWIRTHEPRALADALRAWGVLEEG